MMRNILRVVLPLLVVALGAGVAVKLIKSKPNAKKRERKVAALVVEVIELQPTRARTTISGMGTVTPERTLTLTSQVNGEIVRESPNFEVGGRLKRGEEVVRVDATEHELTVQQREADVDRANFEIQLEKGRRSVAKHEWGMLGAGISNTPDGKRLALRLPHKELAESGLESAKSALARAKLNVARTRITAPFDAIVRAKNATVGQIAGAGSPIATLVSTERFLVNVAVPVDQLAWVKVPGLNANANEGAVAHIVQRNGERQEVRTAKVARILGDLDAAGRMARLVVEVAAPMQLPGAPASGDKPDESAHQAADQTADQAGAKHAQGEPPASTNLPAATLPLLIGAYVRVDIDGKQLDGIYKVPRLALRELDTVWLADAQDRLEMRQITIVWREREHVLARGLNPGERLIVSRVPSAVPGKRLSPHDTKGRKLAAAEPEKPTKSTRPGGPASPTKPAPTRPAPGDVPTPPATQGAAQAAAQ